MEKPTLRLSHTSSISLDEATAGGDVPLYCTMQSSSRTRTCRYYETSNARSLFSTARGIETTICPRKQRLNQKPRALSLMLNTQLDFLQSCDASLHAHDAHLADQFGMPCRLEQATSAVPERHFSGRYLTSRSRRILKRKPLQRNSL